MTLRFKSLRLVQAVAAGLTFYEGEGGEGGAGAGAAGAGGTGGAGAAGAQQQQQPEVAINPLTKKPYTQPELQAEFNRISKNEKDRNNEKNKKTIEELEAVKNRATTSEEDRTRLQTQIDQMTADMQTKEEQQKSALDTLQKKYDGETKKLGAERDTWRNRFESATFEFEVAKAAETHGAFKAQQVAALLSPNKKFVEEVGPDGKPTGKILPKVTFRKMDKDGKEVVLDLSIGDAVKTMVEMPDEYGNLFKSTVKAGFGSSNNGGGASNKSVEDMTDEEYEKSRLDIMANARPRES